MANLAQCLLGGAALSVLAAAPSPAQVTVAPQIKLYSGSYHTKTNIWDPKNLATTSTMTLTGTISEPESYKKWELLWALTPYGSCKFVKEKFPKKTRDAKINFVETGGGYYELFYKLESKTATSDSFSGKIKGRNCGKSPILNLVINTDVTISH